MEETHQTRTEEFKVNGEMLLKKVKDVIAEGNVRRLSIKNKEGATVAEFPLTVGVIGVVIAPVLAAVGALAALIGDCTITVERTVKD
jgi:Flp pilus assembly pilin Flp